MTGTSRAVRPRKSIWMCSRKSTTVEVGSLTTALSSGSRTGTGRSATRQSWSTSLDGVPSTTVRQSRNVHRAVTTHRDNGRPAGSETPSRLTDVRSTRAMPGSIRLAHACQSGPVIPKGFPVLCIRVHRIYEARHPLSIRVPCGRVERRAVIVDIAEFGHAPLCSGCVFTGSRGNPRWRRGERTRITVGRDPGLHVSACVVGSIKQIVFRRRIGIELADS
jgi:hypothetical protein